MLCAIMAVGCHAIYTDLRSRQISNTGIWTLLVVGTIGQLIWWTNDKTDLLQIAVLVIGGFGLAYFLYAYGFWSAGDGKLFWATLVAVPPTICPLFAPTFMSLNSLIWALLINAVIVHFLFLIAFPVAQRSRLPISLRKGFDITFRSTFLACMQLAGLTGLVAEGGRLLSGEPPTFIEGLICVLALYLILQRFVSANSFLVWALPITGILLNVVNFPEAPLALLTLWGAASCIVFVHLVIQSSSEDCLVQAIPVTALQPGMKPVHPIQEPRSHISKEGGIAICAGQELDSISIEKLRQMVTDGQFAERMEVVTPMPFSPFIMASAIVTVLIPGSLVHI